MVEDKNSNNANNDMVLNPVKLFAFLIIAGIIAIGLGTYLNNPYINLAVPIVIMFYYSYTIRYKDEGVLSIEQKADSVYYMGFIYTLVAMTASLVALANNDQLDFNTVVINFGLALTTTIIGLVVRIIWLQLDSQSLDDAESILKDRIIVQTRNLSSETDSIITKMTALSSELETATTTLNEKFDSLNESFDLSTEINTNLTTLIASTESINTTFSNTSETLDSLNPQMELFSNSLGELSESPTYVMELLSRLGQATSSIEQVVSDISHSLRGLNSTVGETQTAVGETQTAITNNNITFAENISFMNNSIQELLESINTNNSNFNTTMDSFTSNMDFLLANIRGSVEEFSNGLLTLRETINQVQEEIIRIANEQDVIDNTNDER